MVSVQLSSFEMTFETQPGEGFEEETLADDPYVQTLYQCSLCQQVFDTYRALQKHCAEHSQSINTFDLKGVKSNVDTDGHLDIALVSDNTLGTATSFGTSSGNESPQIFLELSSDNQDVKPSSSMAIGANMPLNSLEGTIIKEQDGQQYYVVYDVPVSQNSIQPKK